jgi:hypothetical protein
MILTASLTMTSLELTTVLEPRGPAGAIVLDDEQVALIGGGAKVFPVQVTVNGTPVDLRLARMGGENLIGFRREIRERLGIEIGEEIHAVIVRDDTPREIAIPPELQEALDADPVAKAAFERLAPSHRREHTRSVEDAKPREAPSRRSCAP